MDPALEIVHYQRAHPNHHVNSTSIQVSTQKQSLLTQRRWLEQQGALIKKEFMLHDSNNWPTISLPNRQVAGMPSNPYQGRPPYNGAGFQQPPRPQLPPQAYYGQPAGTGFTPGPPAKRARHASAARMPGAAVGMLNTGEAYDDTALADEDTHNFGDTLDMLSPRDISITRYRQHHEWMEEILSSPYAASQIRAVDLGFLLHGEMSQLTEGLFDRSEGVDGDEITNTQVEELEGRVSKFTEEGQSQLKAMKEAHTSKLEQTRAQKLYSDLELRLSQLGSDEGARQAVGEVIHEVENSTGAKIRVRDEVVRVHKGGLILAGEETNNISNDVATQGGDEFGDFTTLDTAGEALDFYSGAYDHMAYAA